MSGRWFEDFEVGQVFDHAISRTITEADNLFFSSLTYNPQPLHIDRHKAAMTEFGQPLVNSLLTLGLMVGLSVHETTLNTTIANLGMTDVLFPRPVFHGDSINVQSEVMEVRSSKSRPRAGIVVFRHVAFNQDKLEVARCTRVALMHRRPLVQGRRHARRS
jgi:acyl dehydratase